MTLRRFAPLALAVLAAACAPDIDQRANATTVDYPLFNPASKLFPLPNDIALSAVQSFATGYPNEDASCSAAGSLTNAGLCAYMRAGGFPASSAVTIAFVRGTLGETGTVAYDASPLDWSGSLTFAELGATTTPNVAVIDATLLQQWYLALTANPPPPTPPPPPAGMLVPVTASFANTTPSTTTPFATGLLTLTPTSAWTAGHKYVVLVRGGANGVKTTAAGAYVAMPTLYILREAVIGDLDLSKTANQGLFPGDAAAKAAAGTQLEPLRVGYQGILTATQILGLAGIDFPFAEIASMQSFPVAVGGTVTLGNGTPATATTAVASAGLIDAFTLDSTLKSATIAGIAVVLTAGESLVSDIFLSEKADCTGSKLGTITAPAAAPTPNVFSALAGTLTSMPSVKPGATKNLFVCGTPTAAGTVSGFVASVVPFTGTGFTVTGSDDVGSLTVTP